MSEKEGIFGFTPEQVDLIRKTVGKDAVNDDEFHRFLYRANKLKLDPLDGTIHLLARNRKNPETGKYEKQNVIIVGIDGFRAVGESTHSMNGIQRGSLFDDKGNLKESWARIYRKDWEYPVEVAVSFKEYCQMKDGKPAGLWATMPRSQNEKCAEAACYRMAFPAALAGIYIAEEIGEDPVEGNPDKKATTKNKDTAAKDGNPADNTKITPSESNPANSGTQKTEELKTKETKTGVEHPNTEKPKNKPPKTDPPKTTPPKESTKTEQPKGETNAGVEAEKPKPESFSGELIIMGETEGINGGWKKMKAFNIVREETVELMTNCGLLDKVNISDHVVVEGQKIGDKINIELISIIAKGGEATGSGTATGGAKTATGSAEVAVGGKSAAAGGEGNAEIASGEKDYVVIVKTNPLEAKKSFEKDANMEVIIWARATIIGGDDVLLVARGGNREALKGVGEGQKINIKGVLALEGDKKILMFNGFVVGSSAA